MALFAIALLSACAKPGPPAAPIQDPAPAFVADCRPCRLEINPKGPPIDFTFEIDSSAQGRVVSAIEVQGGQRLEVHGMLPRSPQQKFFFGATDLNRDGNLDPLIATAQGVANTYADYWRYAPDSQRFVYLGNFPILLADSSTGRLKSYERGGVGGRVYRAGEWGFQGDTLVLLREEVQQAGKDPGEFLKVVRERKSGAGELTEVSREKVTAP